MHDASTSSEPTAFDLRFNGIARLYGREAHEYLRKVRVAVVGIGGVGTWVAEAVARTGFESIVLFDLDEICITNTNRQLHALANTVGQPKVEVMAQRIRDINPQADVTAVNDFITESNVAQHLDEHFDVVLDCIDSLTSKCAILAHCHRRKIPVIAVGGAGGKTDPTRIEVADLRKAYKDPLLASVRKKLRRDYGFSRNAKRRMRIDCVFSPQETVYAQPDGSVCDAKPSDGKGESLKLDCNAGFGSATFVTGAFAFVAVSRAIDKLIAKYHAAADADSASDATSD